MGQDWLIFNISKGKVLNIYDESKLIEKKISIDALLFLLNKSWKNDKIVITGDYDDRYHISDHMKNWIDTFLLPYKNVDLQKYRNHNLYSLESNQLLPQSIYVTNFSYIDEEDDLIFPMEFEDDKEEKNSYFLLNDEKVKYEKNIVLHNYFFINHTKKMYVLFDSSFFQYIHDQKTKRPLQMTLLNTNIVVRNIVIGLLASFSSNGRGVGDIPNYDWIGMWCGDHISFISYKELERNCDLRSYENISQLFSNEEKIFDCYDDVYIIKTKRRYSKDKSSKDKSFSKSPINHLSPLIL